MAAIAAVALRQKRQREMTANSLRIRVANNSDLDGELSDTASRRSAVESRRSSGEWQSYRDGLIRQVRNIEFLEPLHINRETIARVLNEQRGSRQMSWCQNMRVASSMSRLFLSSSSCFLLFASFSIRFLVHSVTEKRSRKILQTAFRSTILP